MRVAHVALIGSLFCGFAAAQQVSVILSSNEGDRLTPKPAIHFSPGVPGEGAAFHIDSSPTNQTMLGFGASILEAGLICLNSLDPAKQEEVLRKLFDPSVGAGFSAMKTTIAGTDFMSAGPWYTYDDTPGDVALKHFSIVRDLGPNGSLTFIKRARKYGKFILQAPMDYPPDWMLYDVNKRQDVSPKYYDALALYYLKYLQEYEKHGVFVDYLSLFNEPGVYTKISFSEIRDLLKDHVGPLFEKEHVRTRLQLSEADNRKRAWREYPIVLDDPAARKYVANLPYHGYDLAHYDKIADLHRRYPDLALWMSELCYAYEAGTPHSMKLPRYDFADGDFWGNIIFSDLEAGASGWTYWNMILDERGGPWLVSKIHGNPDPNIQHPVVIVNRETKQVTYTGLYYYLAHFSKFVRPGFTRLTTAGKVKGVRCMSFRSPDGEIVSEVLNSRKTPANVTLDWNGRSVTTTLPAISIATLSWTSTE